MNVWDFLTFLSVVLLIGWWEWLDHKAGGSK